MFLFTASFVRFRMTGHHLRVVLTNTHHLWENRLGVVINGEQFGVLLDWDTLNVIDLSDHLRDGENDVMLFKRQDSCYKMTLNALLIDETRRSCRRLCARIGALSSTATACRRGKSAK